MKRFLLATSAGLLCAVSAPLLRAQASPTATRNGRLQVGGGVNFASPDYGQKRIAGFAVYGDVDLTYHIGVEAIVHKASYYTPTDIGEDSYLIGPRYVFHLHRFEPYVKLLFGYGTFKFQYDTSPHTSNTYGVYGIGGGLDYRVSRHIKVRGDLEAQRWPNFPSTGLTPTVGTIGVGYAF